MSDTQSKPTVSNPACWAIVPAAGVGRRMGNATPKQYLMLHEREVLAWTLDALLALDFVNKVVLVLPPGDDYFFAKMAAAYPQVEVAAGGQERADSVMNGLHGLHALAKPQDWVLVHDAARPCVDIADISKLYQALQEDEVGGILATPVSDTLKQSDGRQRITETADREVYWLAATPQMFRFGILLEALNQARQRDKKITDEASAVEALGLPVRLVEGRRDNIKITSQEDLALAEFLLGRRKH